MKPLRQDAHIMISLRHVDIQKCHAADVITSYTDADVL